MPVDDMPAWRDISSIEDFVVAVRDAIYLWLLWHTDAEVWAYEWTAGGEVEMTFKDCKGVIGNRYFSFDWKSAAYRRLAQDRIHDTRRCSVCGIIMLPDDWAWCDCEGDYENGLIDEEPEDEPFDPVEDLDELIEYLIDIEFPLDEDILLDTLENEGFEAYSDGLDYVISGYVEEFQEAIKLLDEAIEHDDRWNMLTYSREATRLYHVNGDLISEYGDHVGLDYAVVDDIRDNGFAEHFGEDWVREFLEGE